MRTWILTKDAYADRWWISDDVYHGAGEDHPLVLAKSRESAEFIVAALNEKEQREAAPSPYIYNGTTYEKVEIRPGEDIALMPSETIVWK